ncbi:MAG TPA: hypothetical protein VK937_06105 [Candidatus Limnocylindria bacterium]|jgi:hypothetical protein|nr:hypothetical protein [Candidatus Limnocylindria bacterium]
MWVAKGTLLGLCCSLLVMATIAATSHTPKAPKQVDVHFRFQENVVTLHEPVVVFFEVHNGLAQPITVTVGALVRQYFDFTLTTPNGQVLHKDPFDGQVDTVTVGDGKITVAPGADYQEPLVMNQWFPFASQGTYSLTSRLTSDIETADGSFQAESQSSQLRVIARNPALLNKICAELAKQAQIATTVDAAQFPVRALSYVGDSIAVPYLARVLSAHALAYEKAVQGLERIGNDDAVEVLLSALNENWGDIAELATTSLGRMQDRIANPSLKETVNKAVERSSARARDEFIKTQIAYLDYRSPQLQYAAIQDLTRVREGLQQAEPVLQRLANDPNQPADVRAAAKDALQKLHPPQR